MKLLVFGIALITFANVIRVFAKYGRKISVKNSAEGEKF